MSAPISRDGFSSKFGVVAAAAGSAVGLGNIWRFPYVLGENGGAAFLLVYIFFVFAIGIPVLMSELLIGRKALQSPIGAFKTLAPNAHWHRTGLIGVICSLMILSFYVVVAGWTLHYTYLSISASFVNHTRAQIGGNFNTIAQHGVLSFSWMILFLGITALIVLRGIHSGIEKFSKILMPVLFFLIVLLAIRSLLLPGAWDGLAFLFNPDFSKLTQKVVVDALGQACFSLSIGMGVMITYGSYVSKKQNIASTSVAVAFADLLIALISSIAIFPAVFAFGIDPAQGPGLVFVTLPGIFSQMVGGYFFSIVFFVLLVIAALTSSISLLEVLVAYGKEELKLSRKTSTFLFFCVVALLGFFCAMYPFVFDFMDHVSANYLLPIGAFLIVLFIPIVLKRKETRMELEAHGKKFRFFELYYWIIAIAAPIAIVLIFVNQLGVLDGVF